jgi:ABC-type multidrug transport system ATPase subunit
VDRLRSLAETGALVLLTTHDLDIAEGLLTRVMLLSKGTIVELDTSRGLRASYRGRVEGEAEEANQ